MGLTKNDLQAIKQLIDTSIDTRVPAIIDARVQPMLDKLEDRTYKRLVGLETRLTQRIDDLATDTAMGFQEVHAKIERIGRTDSRSW